VKLGLSHEENFNKYGLHNLYSSPNNDRLVTSSRKRSEGQVPSMWETRIAHKTSFGKPEETELLGKLGVHGRKILK
jgi:hypothetical protein